ncbi:hypothetical protein [Methylobacterium sp. J-070]|nr:hypothetical protein [Methylobacterium sp. J-070]MCJ2049797.1 hypothetical protein [Methylobacterium sp. J-070]
MRFPVAQEPRPVEGRGVSYVTARADPGVTVMRARPLTRPGLGRGAG